MTAVRRLARAVVLALLVSMVTAGVLGGPASAAAATTSLPAAVPGLPADPGPQPGPTPGPAPTPGPRPDPEPGPTPGPTPAPGDPGGHPRPRPTQPEPTPGPTPPACEVTSGDCSGEGAGLFDIPGMITDAISSFLAGIVKQVMKPVRELLADTLLSTPDVTTQPAIARLWTACLALAAGLYVLFVTAGGVTVMGYETVQNRYALKQIAPRLLVGMIAAATSKTVMGMAIGLANALSAAVMGSDLSDAEDGLVEQSLRYILAPAAGGMTYLLFLNCLAAALVIAVLMGYIVRVAVIALLAVAAPLVLSCHAHPVTDGLARMWWRALAGCLSIQVAQSMVFVLGLKLFFAPGNTVLGFPRPSALGTLLAGLALFWVLFKIPGWTTQMIFRPTPIVPPHGTGVLRMLKSVALWQVLNAVAPGAGAVAGRGGAGRGGLQRLIRRAGRPGPGPGGGAGGGGRPGGGGPRPVPGGPPAHPGPAPGPGGGGRLAVAPGGPARRRGPGPAPAGPPPGGARPAPRGPAPRPPRPSPPRAPAVPPPPRRVPRTAPHPSPTSTNRPPLSAPSAASSSAPPAPTAPVGQPVAPLSSRGRLPRTPIPRAQIRPARPMPLRLPLEPPRSTPTPRRPTR
ncbi:hypothetical protein AB0J38_11720 [Streptomyces sp. NPDC050095]|uniref:hypothetical protein n=1 Tax=unclassified Streptomyces TaxID=2593676 RepID=UPI003430E048